MLSYEVLTEMAHHSANINAVELYTTDEGDR